MPPAPILALRGATITFGGRPTFAGLAMALGQGERVCLVGRNGSGKSTLLKVLAGLIELDAGEVFRQPGVRVAYLPQEPLFEQTMEVGAFVAAGLPPAIEGTDRRHLVEAMLDEVELDATRSTATLSGGEGRRAWIARALVSKPDVLLLDEPTNHLDIRAVEWLENRLAAHSAAILMISHDRAFLNRLSQKTLWLDRGSLRELQRGYAAFEEWSETILAAEAAEQARADKRIASETQWSRAGISARRKRNQGRLRKLAEMRELRMQRVTLRQAKLGAATADGGGKLVIELKHVAKSFTGDAGATVIAKDFSTRIMRGDRVGVIGRNGAGKSTLLGLMTGAIAPGTGSVRLGANLAPVLLDQHRAALDPDATLWESLADEGDTVYIRGQPKHVASYLRDFLFEDRQYRAKVSTLSGGERNRLLLAKALAQPSNLLILDEPTNDLDIETLDLLEELLAEYDGTLLLVSHDRDFLDRLVTSVIAVEGGGVIDEYVGGYSDYVRQRRQPAVAGSPPRKAAPAPPPARDRSAARLTWKEQRELEALPRQIATLEAEKTVLERAMADPQHYAGGDRTKLEAAAARHGELAAALAEAEEKWLGLAERAEHLAKGAG